MLIHRYTSIAALALLGLLLGGVIGLASADWRQQSPVRGPGGTVLATAVTPDGRRAATVTDDGHISLWDLNSRKLIRSKHLPDGKPIHLAIRDQGDAIAVAYEDADAVIWWCDGSDKVLTPNVRARLVAFAHQKRLLITVSSSTNYGASWDIDDGTQVGDSTWTGTQLPMAFLTVLPSDNGAIVHDTNLVFNSRGFALEGEIEVYPSSSSGMSTSPEELTVGHSNEKIMLQWFDGSGMWFTGIPRGAGAQAFKEQGSATTRAPVFLRNLLNQPGASYQSKLVNGFVVGGHLEPANDYAPLQYQGNTLESFLTGNTTGDLILYNRVQPNDWIKHPVTWLIIPAFVLYAVVLLRRRWERLENRPPPIDPADAMLTLPLTTRIAAWMTIFFGVLALIDMIYGVFTGNFTLRIDALAVLAGWRILQRRNGWRKFVVFLTWISLLVSAVLVGALVIGRMPMEYTLGAQSGVLPIWAGTLVSLVMLGLSLFVILALTNPRAVQICKAATSPGVSLRERRLAEMKRCTNCGYNTTQTVIDHRRECPECGKHVWYDQQERQWLIEEAGAKPPDADGSS